MTFKRFLMFWFIFTEINIAGQRISFFKEDITFKIEENYFYVNGIYFLKCHQDTYYPITLIYPFPTDSFYSIADSILIFNLTTGKEIKDYLRFDDKVIFSSEVDTIFTLLISYRQQFRSNNVRYILSTTQYWDNPLELATYKLILEKDIKIKSFSYKQDAEDTFGSTKVYYWEKRNFMPLVDMIFTFETDFSSF